MIASVIRIGQANPSFSSSLHGIKLAPIYIHQTFILHFKVRMLLQVHSQAWFNS